MATVQHFLGFDAFAGPPDLDTVRVGGGSESVTAPTSSFTPPAEITFDVPAMAAVTYTSDTPDLSKNVLTSVVTNQLQFVTTASPSFDTITQAVIDGKKAWRAVLPFELFHSFWSTLTFTSPSGKDPLWSISLQSDPTTTPLPIAVYGCLLYTGP
jgi:hypothetical protein